MDEDSPTLVDSSTVRCSGEGIRPHAPVDLVLAVPGLAVCPVCGRRFLRSDEVVNPAAWPNDR